ncbi:hypothetical protein AVEN_271045-1 [Araneus ventricosus]|uniref:DUF19 domain-containing protein n=1 Tax=Araneus ventricosus TaxID=182803 RepID=A0A4Y2FBM7_ARAVE|nr:hypothetical protein AVEN_271045-1 [Araneus ventricosus]
MESKLKIAVLCYLGLFVIVQGLSLEPKLLAKYEKCWTYSSCLSNGKDRRTVYECFEVLRPEELKSLYQTIQDFYKYKSKNFNDSLKEYCELDDGKKSDVYAKSLDGAITYDKEVCADESKKGACTRVTEKFRCLLRNLDHLWQQGKCQVDA